MANKSNLVKPVAAAVGVAFVSSLALSSTAVASENPFDASDLDTGYMLAGGDKHKKEGEEGKCGEGKCGEGKCGEKGEKGEEGSCGEKGEEGSCGEKGEEGKCGEKGEEGKCGGS